LPLLSLQVTGDLSVGAAHPMRHPPHIHRPEEGERTNTNAGRALVGNVLPPLTAVAEGGNTAEVDFDAPWHIDVSVPKRDQDGHDCLRAVHLGLAQIKVEVTKSSDGKRSIPKPQAPASHDVTEQRSGQTGRSAPLAHWLGRGVRQSLTNGYQLLADPSPIGPLDSLRELVERQPSREEVITQRCDRLLTVRVRDTLGQIIQRCGR
jgi:hypothetical protein